MSRYRTAPTSFLFACFLLACLPALASQPADHPNLNPRLRQHQFDPNSPRMQAARKNALDRMSGSSATVTSNTGWWSRYTRYVACTNSPAGSTYPTIEAAILGTGTSQGPVKPYTTIKVCAGMYAGNNILNTSYVSIVGQGNAGAVTISCGTTPNPPGDSDGVEINGSYDNLKNVTVNNCNIGAFISEIGGNVRSDEVENSYFNGNTIGIYSQDCDRCEIETNQVSNSLYEAIYINFDVDDKVTGNGITGSGGTSMSSEGIDVEDSVGVVVKSNTVIASKDGLIARYFDQFMVVENNHFNGNYNGVYVSSNSSGNDFEHNWANGNTVDGFYADATSGADATVGQLPNRYLYNVAYGNGTFDYEDATFGYLGNNSDTNAGTADYYKGNKGNTANPPSILFQ